MRVRSFKLRFHETHVRIALADWEGANVDVRGEDARACFALAEPVVAWLLSRQPSVKLRALSMDLDARRVLVSYEDAHGTAARKPQPMVLRIDASENGELFDRAAPLVLRLASLAAAKIAARR